ncbi:MAG: alginate export family protein [Fuerstiella sp.]
MDLQTLLSAAVCGLLTLSSSLSLAQDTPPPPDAPPVPDTSEEDPNIITRSVNQVRLTGSGCGVDCPVKAGSGTSCAGSHKVLFYNNDFSYLSDPAYSGSCLGDSFKQLSVGECGRYGTMDFGGQYRVRYHNEQGMGRQPGRLGFQDTSNSFWLSRLRLYHNWQLNDNVRIFTEGIIADVDGNAAFLPRGIDENRTDFLNLFVDFKLNDDLNLRVGRQELLFGAERTVSPLDWANTRRTFEGVRATVKKGDWTIDPFYTNVVPVQANAADQADYDQSFYGVYATKKGDSGNLLDLYYLGYDNSNTAAPVSSDFSLHTFGGRVLGKMADYPVLYEAEASYQFGRQSGLANDHTAAFATIGLGHKFENLPWSPTIWGYYDFASGNDVGGDFNRNNQLFPLAHKYLGFLDAVARSNVSSPNARLTVSPTKKLKLLAWYYYIAADERGDVIPGVAVPSAQNTTSKDFGHELDLLASYQITPRSNLTMGYSRLWAGSKIIATNDAELFYTQFTLNF